MKKDKILTISVAAYNLEKLIEDNLNSFVNSDVNDLIEVIVVDDESKDSTPQIVQRYVEMYPDTIKLIKQKNQGPGSTINNGIKHATGKYFRIVDGDDWVKTENLNILVKKLKNIDVDIVITNYEVYNDQEKKVVDSVSFPIESDKEIEFENICKNMHLNMHNVIYKTSIFKENNINIDNCFYTDNEYLLFPIPYVHKAIYYNMDIYVYRVAREGQSVSLLGFQKYNDMHQFVLKRLMMYYEQEKAKMSQNVKLFMANRISKLADEGLVALLTFEINISNKNNIKKYFKDIKSMSPDVYERFVKGKKEKLLLFSNYSLYRFAAKIATKIIMNKFKSKK